MVNVNVTQRAWSDVELVLLGTARGWKRRTRTFDALVKSGLEAIQDDPSSGKSHRIREVFLSPRRDVKTSLRLSRPLSVRTFHLRHVGRPAVHQFLYRIVGEDTVEVGRLLHQGMPIQHHIPLEWVVEAGTHIA